MRKRIDKRVEMERRSEKTREAGDGGSKREVA